MLFIIPFTKSSSYLRGLWLSRSDLARTSQSGEEAQYTSFSKKKHDALFLIACNQIREHSRAQNIGIRMVPELLCQLWPIRKLLMSTDGYTRGTWRQTNLGLQSMCICKKLLTATLISFRHITNSYFATAKWWFATPLCTYVPNDVVMLRRQVLWSKIYCLIIELRVAHFLWFLTDICCH